METIEKDGKQEVASVEVKGEIAPTVSEDRQHQIVRFHRSMRMNKGRAALVVVVVILLGFLYAGRALFIAATVNGSPISRWSIVRELEKQSGEQALDTMVTKKLINAAAAKAKISMSPADIDKEISTITDQVTKQGGTLAMALEQQGMTEQDLRDQILLQKELEKLLGDAALVTDDDVAQYITQTKATAPKGTSDDDFKAQIREQLKGQKFNSAASKWVTDAKAKAQIEYFVDYAPKPAPVPPVATEKSAPAPASAPVSNDAPAPTKQTKQGK